MKKSSFVLATLLLSGACSKVQQLDKRTENMEKSTEKLSTTTEKMSGKTSGMATTMDTQYLQLRSGDSASLRLLSYNSMIGKERTMPNKIADVCFFFKAFEYQLKTDNQLLDNEKMANALYLDATNEFTKRLSATYDEIDINKMSPINDSEKYNEELNFYAFAVGLHMNHHYQELLVEIDSSFQTRSMYDLLKTALTKDYRGEDLLEFEENFVNGPFKEMYIDLIKARVDMIAGLALNNLVVTKKKGLMKKMSLREKENTILFKLTGGKLGGLDLPEISKDANLTTLNTTKLYLEKALSARDFLASIGVEKRIEPQLRSAFENLDISSDSVEKKGSREKDEVKQLIKKLLE